MQVNEAAIWTSVCGDLEVAMSNATFSYWIRPCFIKGITEIDSERVIVEVASPSAFHLQQIDARYYGQIKQALEKQLGKRVELALVVGSSSARVTEGQGGGRQEENETIKTGLFEERKIEQPETKGLFPRFNFDSFVVGRSNNLAYAAAKAVVEYPGVRYNPLFIWGGVGVGKTHLMQAVGHALVSKGFKKVTCVTSEQFTNDLVNSLRSKTVGAFKKQYREVGALLIDDVQFFSGKEASQEEFFHTFNQLYSNGVPIIMTSDRKPQEIEKLEERLTSRFLGGLPVDIGLPDYEMRVAILRQKAVELHANASPEIINLIASNVMTNARELEGVFVRIINEASLSGGAVNQALVEKIVGVKHERENRKLRPIQLISLVAKHFDFKNKDIVGKSRKAELVEARHVAIYLLRDELGLQLTKIGELMGGRDHTTIMHAEEKMKREFESNQTVREKIMKLRQDMYL
ncbi:chromosomal replication initiator protein DnaA [Candidatus Collierbacteria bacterium RIFCSPLOWO2_01_FULL_50_23]|nr:MAG: chromosomal replication initiator protein DnaA [Candidatus Collierbacteria bacterium RIFCSPLOWO2_01_FULL_50_23]